MIAGAKAAGEAGSLMPVHLSGAEACPYSEIAAWPAQNTHHNQRFQIKAAVPRTSMSISSSSSSRLLTPPLPPDTARKVLSRSLPLPPPPRPELSIGLLLFLDRLLNV